VSAEVDISIADTQSESVPASGPTSWEAPKLPPRSRRWWAVPLAVIGLGTGGAFVAGSMIFVDRYAEAPGSASGVNDRLAISAVPTFEPNGKILFVTVSGPHLTGVQAAIGWLDPDVGEDTYVERFGERTPEQDRQVNLRAMRSAKNDAPYVALTKLGYPTKRLPGPAVIEFVFCKEVTADGKSCSASFPADAFLDAGDQFVSVDGVAIQHVEDLDAYMKTKKPGDTVSVTVRRATAADDQTETASVELVSAGGDEADRAIFGVRLGDTTSVELPFAIDISTDRIGGPSAGLAFTLSVIDELTPGELTGGKKVAVTGTIDVDGNVGPIGGLHQKSVAVRNVEADIFIVPASQTPEQLARARRILGDDKVFPVATLDEALEVLAGIGGNAREIGTPGADYTS
jgi:Lon-like protease